MPVKNNKGIMEWPTEIIKQEADANNCKVFMDSFSKCFDKIYPMEHMPTDYCDIYINSFKKCEEFKKLKEVKK